MVLKQLQKRWSSLIALCSVPCGTKFLPFFFAICKNKFPQDKIIFTAKFFSPKMYTTEEFITTILV